MRRQKSLRIGVHHANGVVWGPVYRTHREPAAAGQHDVLYRHPLRLREAVHVHAHAVEHPLGEVVLLPVGSVGSVGSVGPVVARVRLSSSSAPPRVVLFAELFNLVRHVILMPPAVMLGVPLPPSRVLAPARVLGAETHRLVDRPRRRGRDVVRGRRATTLRVVVRVVDRDLGTHDRAEASSSSSSSSSARIAFGPARRRRGVVAAARHGRLPRRAGAKTFPWPRTRRCRHPPSSRARRL